MDSKKKVILAAIVAAIGVVLLVTFTTGKESKTAGNQSVKKPNFKSFDDVVNYYAELQYPDAPEPKDDEYKKARHLWPDIGNPQKVDKEKIRAEWIDFSAKYPENIFIPDEFKKPLNEKEKQERQKSLDNYTSVSSRIAALKAGSKYADQGTPAPSTSETSFSKEEQKSFLEYKTKETKSKLEILEYFMEKGSPDEEQKTIAQKDMEEMKKEIEQYTRLLNEIPK